MGLIFYNILLIGGIIFGFPFILLAVIISKKRRKTLLPRLGFTSFSGSNQDGRSANKRLKPIWMHGLSVGEIRSAVSLTQHIRDRFPDRWIFFSASTHTGFETAQALLKNTVDAVFYFPYDLPRLVKRTIERIDPGLVIMVESDIWPNFVFEIQKRHIPMMLANARLSDRSFRRYHRVPFIAKHLYSAFSVICMQSARDAERFAHLGVAENKILMTGNIKFDRFDPLISPMEAVEMRKEMGISNDRKIFLAGSTHKGEEVIILYAFKQLKKTHPDLLMMIAPRDPSRSQDIMQLARSDELISICAGEKDVINHHREKDIIIIDTMGELNRLYAIADIAFVGGSLVGVGGHNPIEPAAYATPILFGPDMSDFKAISDMLIESKGAMRVKNAEDIHQSVLSFLDHPDVAKKMGANAFRIFTDNRGAVEKVVTAIDKYIS